MTRSGTGRRARRWSIGGAAFVVALVALVLGARTGGQSTPGSADTTLRYTVSVPEPAHRWMAVELQIDGLAETPLSLRMSSASPGRYARHDFAKNIFMVEITDGGGAPLEASRVSPTRWDVAEHDGTVTFSYRIFGDRVDGTYLAVDRTHAHLNMPASLVWPAGLETRPIEIRFVPPPDQRWRVATQLFPTDDPLRFTAPNLAYLLDSPTEFSDFADRTFEVVDPSDPTHRPSFRVAVHHTGSDDDVDRYVADVERIVREMVTVFGEFPRFETGRYTFLADYLPSASGDAMEHRNSTVLSAPATLRSQGRQLLGSVSHEFFHVWNVERIRPRSLEPFDFETVNPSGELWLAEGFTNYYGALTLQRAGLASLDATLGRFGRAIETVRHGPGRQFRSAVDMSRLAVFTDAATSIDPTNWDNLFISYYTWGETLGLGLDLLLRARSVDETGQPRLSLDDYMRLLWRRFGQQGGAEPGAVERPYTMADARAALGELTDPAFAADYFDRYVEGREVIDYAPLLERAGVAVVETAPDQAWLGDPALRFERGGARIVRPVPLESPVYQAGLDQDDVVVSIDNREVSSSSRWRETVGRLLPGRSVPISYARGGELHSARITPVAHPGQRLVAIEALGRTLTPSQAAFRDAWLGSRQ
ncbi:MAG: peptidase M61 [Acidimicrobiaceae bacterium]|mgnify:CR=1 FL=1|nr:peptidase M61 [Acidimicrobiaceae bacterium]